ncbi:MAG: helicase [Hoeflea sp.]|uniref:helicase-related protein n=1 Tax=Hoeflea sp. TaxID=1940281 RepID=UPI001D6B1881|nr:helicase-related protein [Hoeflea sp.]MBU4528568.1 helicase [Alphaproteobacteria bacterium]MBU4545627.1 helicase [Alphaproteobacteria bacterium]MBU4552237.1 helicase [Alphaproteobacteria bacterium]MBV1726171.1 helicase [Hoeflea sp.]MBV1762402.1 helicase [Hoeflea sp.]
MPASPRHPPKPLILSGRGVTAVLGPTNTGKTHYAIERMAAHSSGVIGLPLRLLAREVYGRMVDKVGVKNVSLVTGEEKITPPGARYSVCTVEAMPQEANVAFVAIDEVQIAGDFERGHVFTDRILSLRGREETLLLGSATVRGILEQLLPGITVVERPRLSELHYAGSKKITRLPRRTAIVAFSAEEVYAIAELVRRQRGGAAVVLGALSPRTRNAQVELYQNGDVDYLVATDAIGMGLNLDVDHVAFAQDRKFDGYSYRQLTASEFGQIAGRAGRHLRDGTFGVTGQVEPLPDDLVQRLESHVFEPVKILQWRSKQLDFSSLKALQASLEQIPAIQGLTRALPAVDQRALEHLVNDFEVRDLASSPRNVATLWDVCSLPDYRRIAPAQHADLIATIYRDLIRTGTVNEDFLAEQVRRTDSTDGEIDTLSARISQIRTWTYISNRAEWLADPTHWQEKTREIEDRLSDALHERLTKRFVDRRTSVLMRRLRENAMLEAEISVNGDVFVEGHHIGQLAGFRFVADSSADGPDAKAVIAAAQKALALEFEARAARLHASGNSDFAIGADGTVRWLGDPVARLAAGDHVLKPRSILLADEQLTGTARDFVVARIDRFVNHHIATVLKPLDDLTRAEDLDGLARGLAFRLAENLGILFRRDVAEMIKDLDQAARASLRKYGIRFGAYHIFMPALLKPAPAELVTLLWALANDGFGKPGYGDVTPLLAAGRTSVATDPEIDREFYRLAGFRFLGKRAVRVDILERLADLIRPALQWKPGVPGARPEAAYDGRRFITTTGMLSILGATQDDIEEILKGLGYRADSVPAEEAQTHIATLDAAQLETATPAGSGPVVEVVVSRTAADRPHKPAAPASAIAVTETAPADAAQSEGTNPVEAQAPAEEIKPLETAADAPKDTVPASEPVADAAPASEPVAPADEEKADATPEAGATSEPAPEEVVEEPRPVLLWRPGGRQDGQQRGPRHAAGAPGAPGEGRGRRDRGNRSGDKPAGEAGSEAEARPGKGHRGKPHHGKGGPGKGGFGKGGPGGRGGPDKGAASHDGGRNDRPVRKEKPIDPDSPFAALAALRDKLKK